MQRDCRFFVLLTLLVGLAYAQRTPQTLELSANDVIAGDQLNATCTGSSSIVSRTLHIDGQGVEIRISADRLNISQGPQGQNFTTWIIDPVERGDAGEYLCFVSDQSDVDESSTPQNVTVYFAPIFSHNEQEQEANVSINITAAAETSDFYIVCNVSASVPMVTSLTLTSPAAADNVEFNNITGFITISSVTSDNTGTYTCTADNGITTPINISFVLTVTSPPSTSSPGMQTTSVPAVAPSATQMSQASTTEMSTASPIPMLEASSTPGSARNVQAVVAVTVIMLLIAVFLS